MGTDPINQNAMPLEEEFNAFNQNGLNPAQKGAVVNWQDKNPGSVEFTELGTLMQVAV